MDDNTKQEVLEIFREAFQPDPIVPEEESKVNRQYNLRQVAAALVSYVAGWLYINRAGAYELYYVMFGLVFSAGGLLYFRENIKSREHWVWLACMWMTLLCDTFGSDRVWGGSSALFTHGFAIYWMLCLSGHLMEGRSGAYLLLDGIHGAFSYPYKNLFTFLRLRVMWWGLRQIGPKKKTSAGRGYALLAIGVSVVMLLVAGKLLVQADDHFGSFLNLFRIELDLDNLGIYFARFLLSIPVGAYLYGLVVGTGREDMEKLKQQREGIHDFLMGIKKVPNKLWMFLTACFVVFYLMFFGVQGSYLFGAFARNLPEGFTVALYARQGFFELCGIMGLNFCLLWLVCYSSISPVRENKSTRIICTVLLAESILFAVTAMSKLILYIDCFGFTPLRLQSFWGVTVLMAGCICCLVSLWTKKETARIWILFTGISLALLHLY